ncbi:MAG TPA: helix-turn-helix domain-containing protein [Solirubrobacterales bacterium]|nr:helix-turn-helix domain-containing protein [Solirubrobacterales bacterium]
MGDQLVEVLAIDGELADGLDGTRLDGARRNCVSPVITVARGTWQPHGLDSPDPGGFGLLVLSGFLVRRVGQGGRYGAELLGPGDLLRPWQTVGQVASIPFEPRWEAIADTRLAILGSSFARRASPYPSVASQIVGRAMLRSRHLAVNLAIVQQARIDTRLRMLFWHLADRWGRTGTSGVTLDVPLTHSLLGGLVAARRPTVSTAIAGLVREGVLERSEEGWLLRGGPPQELIDLTAFPESAELAAEAMPQAPGDI